MRLVICGSHALINEQKVALKRVIEKHGFQYDETKMVTQRWTPDLGELGLSCVHVEIAGAVAGVEDGTAFLCEALELAGVYNSCAEHDKQRFLERRKAYYASPGAEESTRA